MSKQINPLNIKDATLAQIVEYAYGPAVARAKQERTRVLQQLYLQLTHWLQTRAAAWRSQPKTRTTRTENAVRLKTLLVFICAIGTLGAVGTGVADAAALMWETQAILNAPESALYDAKMNRIFVSNMGGSPTEKDGNGTIVVLSMNGKIVNDKFTTGLHAPKGLAQSGNKLYVADIDTLVEIDATSGELVKKYAAPEAKLLNDVAVNSKGDVFVSDMLGNALYRLSKGRFEPWLQSDALENPNGLHAEKDRLIVGSWGKLGKNGFSTEVAGHLKAVMYKSLIVKSLGNGKPVGNIDGVESDGQGNYIVTDWIAGKVLRVTAGGGAAEMLSLEQGAADHEVILDKGLVVVPMMTQNKVVAYKLK